MRGTSSRWAAGDELRGRRTRPTPLSLVLSCILCVAGSLGVLWAAVALSDRHGPGGRFAPVRSVDLTAPAPLARAGPAAPQAPSATLRIGISPVVSPEASVGLYRDLVAYLGRAVGRRGLLLRRRTYGEVNNLIQFGRCDLAFVCTYAFIRGEQGFGMRALVVPVIGGKTTYRSYVIVPSPSPARTLEDLRGKRFASADLLSNSGWLFPATYLIDRGEDPARFFAEHVITGSHDRSVRAVASGFVDGAAVDHLVYEYLVAGDPAVAAKTRVVLRSPPFGMPPVVVPPRLDPGLERRLRRAFLHMHEDENGRRALAPLGIERFVIPARGMFQSVRQAARKWESRR